MADMLMAIGFFALGLLLWAIFFWAIPAYLADKIIKALFPTLHAKSVGLRWWQEYLFIFSLLIIIILSLLRLGVDTYLQIPTWFPWAPEGLHHMYHEFSFPTPVAVFIGRFAAVLYFGWRPEIRNRSK